MPDGQRSHPEMIQIVPNSGPKCSRSREGGLGKETHGYGLSEIMRITGSGPLDWAR
jgi:hypothetical protein